MNCEDAKNSCGCGYCRTVVFSSPPVISPVIEEILKRIDELEKWKQIAIEKNIQDINRIRELEKHKNYQIDENRKISKRVDELEKMQKAMIEMPNTVFRNYHKTPYKCPVCDGNARVKLDKPMVYDNGNFYYMSCVSCKDQGIVWG